MKRLSHLTLLLICLTVLFASFVIGQDNQQRLLPKKPITFSLSPNETQSFTLQMREDDFAEIIWIANDNVNLNSKIYDSDKKDLSKIYSVNDESVLFIAPKEDKYTLVVEFDKRSEINGKQNISIEYINLFKLPAGTKQNSIRMINGYDIRIMTTPESDIETRYSIVLIQKAGKLKRVLKAFGDGSIAGFSFGDDLSRAYTLQAKRSVNLVKTTLDKSGDTIPDVMIDYYSGGAHCCAETYFFNLGESAELIDSIFTAHDGIVAIKKNPKGGLIFAVGDTSYAYWQGGFAGSHFPEVLLDFKSGTLRPNFELMKKTPPSLLTLKRKAYAVQNKLSLEPYKGVDDEDSVLYKDEFLGEPAFWGTMLDLIYSGNESLAWQYLDLVWSPQKQGKAIFREDLKNKINESPFWQMIQEDKKNKF